MSEWDKVFDWVASGLVETGYLWPVAFHDMPLLLGMVTGLKEHAESRE